MIYITLALWALTCGLVFWCFIKLLGAVSEAERLMDQKGRARRWSYRKMRNEFRTHPKFLHWFRNDKGVQFRHNTLLQSLLNRLN